MTHLLTENAACIDREIEWFRKVLEDRIKDHLSDEPEYFELEPPQLPDGPVPYAAVVRGLEMGAPERLVLILAFLPYIRPEVLDPLLLQNEALARRFTEFGGIVDTLHSGFIPTAETALFLLAGCDTERRLALLGLFHPDCYLYRFNVLKLDRRSDDAPPLAATLKVTQGFVELVTTGENYWPPFSAEFPARRIITAYEWEDLVVDADTLGELEDIVNWVRYREKLLSEWGLDRRVKPGYRSLFYGPPGTGKTLTAALLGKATGMPVFRIDLSSVISKYIGETEKNLASLFDQAENQGWILFFDEADSLFGKRTETRNSNDRAANQQVSYLLQRIEDFNGIVILASNMRSRIDDAFSRRFQSLIHFSMPTPEQRLRLWRDSFQGKPYRLAGDVDLKALADEYELSGGCIVNVLRYVCLKAVTRGSTEIQLDDLVVAVRKERYKEGKLMSS